MALKLINELSNPFNPEKYSDTYTDEIKEIIRKKAKGQKISMPKEAKEPKIQNMIALLKQSLKKKSAKKSKKRKAA